MLNVSTREPKVPRVFRNFKTLRGGERFSGKNFGNPEGPSTRRLLTLFNTTKINFHYQGT